MVSVEGSLLCLNQRGSTDVQNVGLIPNAERVLHSLDCWNVIWTCSYSTLEYSDSERPEMTFLWTLNEAVGVKNRRWNANSMEQSPCWGANSVTATEEIHCISWNQQVCITSRQLSLSWARRIQSTSSQLPLRPIRILSSHPRPSSLSRLRFPTKILYAFFVFFVRATFPPMSSLMTLVIFGEKQKLLSSRLLNVPSE